MIARRVRGRGQAVLVASFLAPSLVLHSVFVVLPGIAAVVLSFTNWTLSGPNALHPQWVGLANYGRPTGNSQFQAAAWRTVQFGVLVGDRRSVRVRPPGGSAAGAP